MKKSPEKIYEVGKSKKEETLLFIEIPKKGWQTLEAITKIVGGDFRMKVN